jgi:hypothetical protein
MRFDPFRLLEWLKRDGFEQGRFDSLVKEYSYVRAGFLAGTFEHIRVKCGGRSGEVAWATVGVSCAKRCPAKGLIELDLLRELATDNDRGWADVRTVAQARRWEVSLAAIASTRATKLANEMGPALLNRTLAARSMAKKYMDLAGRWAIQDLDAKATGEQKELVRRVLDRPGVLACEELRPAYHWAVLLLAVRGEETEYSGLSALEVDPFQAEELLWCLHLLADCLPRDAISPWN